MDPLVQAAVVTAAAAVIGAFFGFRSTRLVERSRNAVESVSLQLDSWKDLNAAKDAELDRQAGVINSLRTEIRNLNAELSAQRRETRPPTLRTRHDDYE